MLAKELFQSILNQLQEFPEKESSAIVKLLLEKKLNLSFAQILANAPIEVSADQMAGIEQDIERLKKNEPIQYVLNEAHFYGRDFFVDSRVLIPRPETEELIAIILRHAPKTGVLVDIGTGSGCVAVTAAVENQNWDVHGIDISRDALAVAAQNAEKFNAEITLHQCDILVDPLPQSADMIVSNPPYVLDSEGAQMKANVLSHEPHPALFVPDNDPLRFYQRIVSLSQTQLNPGGFLFFEINEKFGRQVSSLLADANFQSVTVLTDIHEKNRFVMGQKSAST